MIVRENDMFINEECMEKKLIEHCALTLAGIKSASLFRYLYKREGGARKEIKRINQLLNCKGVYIDSLMWKEDSVLIYVYRPVVLERELKNPGVFELLKKYGYESCDLASCLECLKFRMPHSSCFPHEIGIFLGYPLEDVYGFIVNRGKNCKSCGMWKVYCNKEEKDRLFQRFQKCKDVYQQLFCKGGNLFQMTVCT